MIKQKESLWVEDEFERRCNRYYLILLLSRLQFKWNNVINDAAETSGTIICSATLLSKQSVIPTYEKFVNWFDNVTLTQEQVEYLSNKLDAKQMFNANGELGRLSWTQYVQCGIYLKSGQQRAVCELVLLFL